MRALLDRSASSTYYVVDYQPMSQTGGAICRHTGPVGVGWKNAGCHFCTMTHTTTTATHPHSQEEDGVRRGCPIGRSTSRAYVRQNRCRHARTGNVSMIRLLLCRGANINALNRDHETPLHIAVAAWHEPAVRLLLEWGASTTPPDGTFKLTAQGAAANQKLAWAGELFLAHGPVPTLQMLCRLALCKNNSSLYTRHVIHRQNTQSEACEHVFTEWPNGKGLHSSEPGLESTNGQSTCLNGMNESDRHEGNGFSNHSNDANGLTDYGKEMEQLTNHKHSAADSLSNGVQSLKIAANGTAANGMSANRNEGTRAWYVDGSVDYRAPMRLDVYLGMSEELQASMMG